MNVGPLFISHSQTAPLKEPLEARFDDIAKHSQTAPVFSISLRDRGFNAPLPQFLADLHFGVVGRVCQDFIRPLFASAVRLLDGRDGIDQRNGALRVMHVCARVLDRQRDPLGVGDQVTLRAPLAPICRIWACFLAPKIARTEQLSMTAQDRSISPAKPSLSSSNSQIFCQTPASCQSRNRRQHVMPLPQPISCGR